MPGGYGGYSYGTGGSYGGPLSGVRTRDIAECRYVLFIDGVGTAFSNDGGDQGTILGAGGSTWMGRSESSIGGHEVFGQRVVKAGLILPGEVECGGDPKGIGLDRSSTTFRILDEDGTVGDLFATASVEPDLLLQRIPPGTTNLGTSVLAEGPISGGGGTINPRGKWIGLERIGPSGQRRFFHAYPFQGIGYDHQGDTNDRLPPVPISTSPIIHEGRLVTLWRIYANPSISPSFTTRWYTWDEAWTAGDLVWWGVLQDRGTYTGDRIWELECFGAEAPLERQLGTTVDARAWNVSAPLKTVVDINDQIFIAFGNSELPFRVGPGGFDDLEDSTAGHAGQHWYQGRAWTGLAGLTRIDLIDEINALVEDTATGTGTDYHTTFDPYDQWEDFTGALQVGAGGVSPAGLTTFGFYLHANPFPAHTFYPSYGIMTVAMHSSRWEALGYDVQAQDGDANPYPTTADGGQYVVQFTKLHQGELYAPLDGGDHSDGAIVPGTGYWEGKFTTVGVGGNTTYEDFWVWDTWRNDGQRREFWPLNQGEDQIFALDLGGEQEIVLDTGSDSPFWEPQPTVPRTSDAQVDGADTDSARWFVLKGKARLEVGTDESGEPVFEDQDHIAVCDASWVAGSAYGDVATGATGLGPGLYIQRYRDPRLFGFNRTKMKADGTWKGNHHDYAISIAPLNCYTFGHGSPIEWAHLLFGALLVSTGTSEGFDAPLSEGGILDLGVNQWPGVTATGDIELADLGLGIPWQMVASPLEYSGEFGKMAGGLGGDLNRMRLCYAGSFESIDALESILKPRRLRIGLHGKRYGVYRLDNFSPDDADVVLTEDDLVGKVADPTTVIPKQSIRAHGAVDGALVEYGFEPGGSAQLEHRQRALDYNARWRRGDLFETVSGRGLIPNEWMQGTAAEGDGWKPLFLEEWGRQAPEFFARRHFVVEVVVARPKGQDMMAGTRVLFSNRWPIAPDGQYGLTNRIGRVIWTSHVLDEQDDTYHGACRARILVFGDAGFQPVFAPFVFVTEVDGNTVHYDIAGNFSGFAINECESSRGWVPPDWVSSGNAEMRIWYQTPSGGWAQSNSAEVTASNEAAATITTASPLVVPPNTYTMIGVLSTWVTNDGTFVRDIYAPIVEHDGTHDGSEFGRRWVP